MLILAATCTARQARRDPENWKIRVKYIGDCLAVQTPTWGLRQDPLISLHLIPSSIQELAVDLAGIRRYMRLYMPRTLSDLVQHTDVTMLSNTAADYFTQDWLQWIARATDEEGLGLIMVGGLCSFGGYAGYGYPDWAGTQVGRMLPVDSIVVNGVANRNFAFRLSPAVPEDPLLSAFDWSRGPFFFSINTVGMKPGARMLATSDPEDRPLLAYQEVGGGSSLAFMSTWGSPWGSEFVKWEYFLDFSADMIYYSAGLEIPDPAVVHEIRIQFQKIQLAEELVRSVLDFVDRLGGRVTAVQRSLDELTAEKAKAEKLYVDQDYGGCRMSLSEMLARTSGLSDQALRAKNAAFIWIYVTEWSAVAATFFLSGYVLYSTMIRRSLYRQAMSTRTSS